MLKHRVASPDDDNIKSQTWSGVEMKELSEDNTVYRITETQIFSDYLHSKQWWTDLCPQHNTLFRYEFSCQGPEH